MMQVTNILNSKKVQNSKWVSDKLKSYKMPDSKVEN